MGTERTPLTLGEKLADLRKEKKMTLKEVAKQTGLSISTISIYENDTRPPTAESLCKLLQVYGVTIEEIYGIESSDSQEQQEDLKTFKRYGFSEKFFRGFVLLEKYDGQLIAKCLNRLFESPVSSLIFFEKLSRALDPAYHKKLASLSSVFSHDASMRFLLEPVIESLILMFEAQYPEF